jgi:hypothetical protein
VSGRLRSLGVALGGALALAGALIAACYEIPRPACGFLCGPAGACPDGYSCAADMYCHRNDAPLDLVCTHPDAPLPADANPDTRASADATIDAAPDAGDDAAIDAGDDAAVDAAIDAP